MTTKLLKIHVLKNKKRNFLRKIKAAYYSYDLLQHSEMHYEEKSRERSLPIILLEETLLKINGKNSHIFSDLKSK